MDADGGKTGEYGAFAREKVDDVVGASFRPWATPVAPS
jgi:hypothetical protein